MSVYLVRWPVQRCHRLGAHDPHEWTANGATLTTGWWCWG